jgi:serine/threonine protein kinase
MEINNWDRVQHLFLSAADLAPGEQARFIDFACAGDTALRAEVESLLASDRKNGAAISAAVEVEAALLFDSPTLKGERLGAYRLVREIGRGGMGAVYLAIRDDDQYRKQVAIKVSRSTSRRRPRVKRGMDTVELLERFRHERQILANLDHPYIARLIDGGTTADGRPFFAMEYIEGRPVDAFCAEHALDTDARCRLFLRICEAISHAHRNLVVHRDLKPGNIFVTSDGTPKLLDFGVAKLLGGDGRWGETLPTMQRPFTPEYASPEQVRGLPITTATDVYSLGVVFYELLTGQRARAVRAKSPFEVEPAVCASEVVRPSLVARNLDPDLDNIVLMAVRKEAERRYQSVDQFADDVRRYMEGRPMAARQDSFGYRSRKFLRRNRFSAAAAAAVLVSLVTGIVVSVTESRQAEAARRTADAERLVAVRERSRAEAEARQAEAAHQAEAQQRRIADQQRDSVSAPSPSGAPRI